jgi:hypothetical protein
MDSLHPLNQVLDPLPYACIDAVNKHGATLERLGCRTLADVRKLPRGGISRRFDSELLLALDQAYGLRPEGYPWVHLPETFTAKLELPGRVDTAPGLMFGARRLLVQMGGWLAARHCGVTAFTLHWCHDAMRSRDAGDGGQITVRTAQATQNVEHLTRLLTENLAKVQLLAPAGDLVLNATEVTPLAKASLSLLPDPRETGEALDRVLERIEARLGKKRVLRPVLTEDLRMEWMNRWQPMNAKRPTTKVRQVTGPQPSWILRTPLKLDVKDERPLYQGPLQLLLGPERVEGGLVASGHERQGSAQSECGTRLLGGLESVCGGAVDFSAAVAARGDGVLVLAWALCLKPCHYRSCGLHLHHVQSPRQPARLCRIALPLQLLVFCGVPVNQKNWFCVPRSWGTQPWPSPMNAPWPGSCGPMCRPRPADSNS